ncbi:hypothetical protein STAS_25950 [Striga asiatica]|uniref:WEB family protein n=1 Tax=Striga asiatica TaxID=4170 RepID=A0A5A7QTV8_STRAF|nr:hypothetical protein STAS_25950 [Striga asiatica]
MSTKSKSAASSETPNAKVSPATPRASKSSSIRGVSKSNAGSGSPSPLQNPRLSVDGSPRSLPSKPTGRSPKLTTPPEASLRKFITFTCIIFVNRAFSSSPGCVPSISSQKKATPTRIPKPSGSELQTEINHVQEDLKRAKEQLASLEKEKEKDLKRAKEQLASLEKEKEKDLKRAKEQLASLEKEKEKALDDLKEAQRLAEEADEKLKEALMAQKRAEENSEIEKFRAVEMEQASIEAAQKKEEEWQKELETVRNQHAVDVAALLTATQEIQKATQELAMIRDAKDQALRHADDVTKIAEAHAEKIELLSSELAHLKSALNSRADIEASENNKLVTKLQLEIESLRCELEKGKSLEETLKEKEVAMEQLNVDLEAARMAESYARSIVDELHERVENLSSHAEQSKRLERSASESLESVMKQLEGSNDSLHEAEAEIAALKEKIGLLEISMRSQKKDLEEVGRCFDEAKGEVSKMGKEVESLKSELEMVKEEKNQSLNNEKLAAASVMTLLEEKNELINELGISRDEEEKSKKALESLASALHEVSSEARESKEKLLSMQVEQENYESQIEDLKLVLKAKNEKYESMLEEARLEIEELTGSIDNLKHNHESLKAEWEQKELQLTNTVKKSGEEKSSMENEINRLINLLRASEEQVFAARDECVSWKNSLKEAESEAVYLKEVLGEAKAESMKLKESLMDRENELQNVLHENEELMKREAASLEKVEELSKQLEEALLANNGKKRQEEGNGELTDSEKDYHMLPEVVEYSEQNGTMGNVKPKVVEEERTLADDEKEKSIHEVENSNSKIKNENEKENSDSAEVDFKMWESCKIEEKDFSPEHESFEEDEIESKADGAESFDQVNNGANENVDNGGNSPSKEQQSSSQKKKKPLLRKFGNLLKKKGTTTQK